MNPLRSLVANLVLAIISIGILVQRRIHIGPHYGGEWYR
jgi:hypothetical protein